jgi:hypothetical protein
MVEIRRFTRSDVPGIVQLYTRVFGGGSRVPARGLAGFIDEVFFHSPWLEDGLPSLVAADAEGDILGFIGVFGRPMMLGKRRLRMAVSNLFMVDPERRSSLVAVRLMQGFFNGPQDLSIAQGSDTSRRLWTGLGGHWSHLYSLNWVRPLRPTRYFASLLPDGSAIDRLDWAVSPLCAAADGLAGRFAPRSFTGFTRERHDVVETELDAETHLEGLAASFRSRSLVPIYDKTSLEWLLGLFRSKTQYGCLRQRAVRTSDGELLGGYVYYTKRGDVSRVMQLFAQPDDVDAVLDSLCRDAWRAGATALTAGFDPAFAKQLADHKCLAAQGNTFTTIHSRDPEILAAFERGEAFFTRLEGEWMFFGLGGSEAY